LDISHCSGLTVQDVHLFRQMDPNALQHLREINLAGVSQGTTSAPPSPVPYSLVISRCQISGMDYNASQDLANALTTLANSGKPLTVIAYDDERLTRPRFGLTRSLPLPPPQR